jgi:hypothetical protein
MPTQNPRQLSDVLRSLDTVMLTTIDQTDQLVSRPMAACVDDFAGTLWFFAPMKSRIIVNISANPKVNISYAGPLTSLSIAGTATFTPNLAKISARWHSGLKPVVSRRHGRCRDDRGRRRRGTVMDRPGFLGPRPPALPPGVQPRLGQAPQPSVTLRASRCETQR